VNRKKKLLIHDISGIKPLKLQMAFSIWTPARVHVNCSKSIVKAVPE
jgi:hypothetical protein